MLIILLALLPVPPKISNESVHANEIQRQMQGDTLQAVFDLIVALLSEIAQDRAVMDCADRKRCICFPTLSSWSVHHAQHTILDRRSSKSCRRCEVLATELS